MPDNLLTRYTERAKTMQTNELRYAINDIMATPGFKDNHDPEYTRKLYAEFDAYTVELHKRSYGKKLFTTT